MRWYRDWRGRRWCADRRQLMRSRAPTVVLPDLPVPSGPLPPVLLAATPATRLQSVVSDEAECHGVDAAKAEPTAAARYSSSHVALRRIRPFLALLLLAPSPLSDHWHVGYAELSRQLVPRGTLGLPSDDLLPHRPVTAISLLRAMDLHHLRLESSVESPREGRHWNRHRRIVDFSLC